MSHDKFLEGGGKTGRLIRKHKWCNSSLGKIEVWPQSLLTIISVLINTNAPMFLFWGSELVCFYNDAFDSNFNIKGSEFAIRESAEQNWLKMWDDIRPFIDEVTMNGAGAINEDQLLSVFRNGNEKDEYWTFNYSPVKVEDGSVGGVLLICNETTGKVLSLRKAVESNQSEKRFKSLIEESSIPMCFYMGRELKIEIINDELLKVWGRDQSVIGKTLVEALPELAGQPFLKLLDDVYTSGVPYLIKDAIYQIEKNGELETSYFDLWYKPLVDDDGAVYGILASGVDVTEKVISQKQVQESELRFRSIVENATVAIGLTEGKDFVFKNINGHMLQLIGKTIDAIGKPLFSVLPELAGQLIEQLLHKVFESGEPYMGYEIPATLIVNEKEEERFYNISYIPLPEKGEADFILHIAVDVTLQVHARKKIEEAEEKARLAIESADLGSYEINFITGEMRTTERFNEIWGANYGQLQRSEFISAIHPDDRMLRNHAHEQSRITGKLFYECRILRNDGSIRWVKVNGKVLLDKAGEANLLLGVIQDITEQKNLQQQKDNFIAMASHELKTPLTSIKAYAQVIEMMLLEQGTDKEAAMVGRMDIQINRLAKLISDLLNIGNINAGRLEYKRESFNFNDLVYEMVEELQRTTQQHNLLVKLLTPVFIFGDKERISQVITNFISNAIKYSPYAKTINIFTRIDEKDLVFCVQDFGIGIAKDEQQKVFEQFYRVNNSKHQTFQGFGLGLYISSDIIKREGGKIWVNSIEGEGSTFCFSLPLEKEIFEEKFRDGSII